MSRVRAFVRRDWDATVERFLEWTWERLGFIVAVVILGLSLIVVAAEVGRRIS